jgi:hypothetical protein
MKKRDEFDSAGEARGYISLDQAVHQALRIAKQDEGRYVQRLGWDEIVWTEASSEQSEDYYKVVLRFNQPTRHSSEEDTGEEEFRFDLTGSLEVRQVRVWPKGAVSEEDEPPPPPPIPEQIKDMLSSRPSLLSQLREKFGVPKERSQFYMDKFILRPDERVILDVLVQFPMHFFGLSRAPTGSMGITNRRYLFVRNAVFGPDLTEYGLNYRDIRDIRERPGPRGIEFGIYSKTFMRIYIPTSHRDLLVQYLRSL